MNRRTFMKGVAAVSAATMVSLRWINEHIPFGPWFITEVRYYDRRLSDDELEKMSKGIFPEE